MLVFPQVLVQLSPNVGNLRDIKPPLDVPPNYLPYILLSVFILVIVVSFIWIYLQKRHHTNQSAESVEVTATPPHEIAIEHLNTLEATSCDMVTYHTRISHIIREYIAARYQIPALELTTTGLVLQMTNTQIDNLYVEHLHQFLVNCDRVKFTKYQPNSSEADARMMDARWIVEEKNTLE